MAWTVLGTAQPLSSQGNRGHLVSLKESAANDQDKSVVASDANFGGYTFTTLQITRIRVEYIAFADAGANRLFDMELLDSGSTIIWNLRPESGVTVVQGTTYHVQYDPEDMNPVTRGALGVAVGLPDRHWMEPITLHSGQSLRYYARSGANAADDMQIHVEGIAW